MNKTMIVAGFELRSAVTTRGFWIQLLIVPLIMALTIVIMRVTQRQQPPTVYVIIDQARDIAQPLIDIFDRPPAGAPANNNNSAIRVPVPREIDIFQEPGALAEALTPYLKGDIKVVTDKGPRSLVAAVVIPQGFGASPGAAVQVLSIRPIQGNFVTQMRGALTQIMRARAFEARGVDPQVVAQIQGIFAPVMAVSPEQQGRQRNAQSDVARLVGPLALSLLLFMSAMTGGARLLPSMIEERSNKLVEVLLSSVTADQLMIGKLVGNVLVGLVVLAVWVATAAVAMRSVPLGSDIATIVSGILTAKTIAAFVVYFLAAYLMYAALFLGAGSMVDSVQDAQSFMAPLMMIIMLPMIMLTPVILNPHGTIAVVLTWIPLYTPMAMMMRLPADPPLWEVIGSTALMMAFIAVLVWGLARLFRVSIVSAGGAIRMSQIWRVLTDIS